MRKYLTAGLLLATAASLPACGGLIPTAGFIAARQVQWNRMDEIENRWVERRADRSKVREQLASLPSDSDEAAPLKERLAALNAEIADLAKQLDLPQ